jgi:hypothetical protein
VNPNHWSRRVTADNPHGFVEKTLAKLRAIEDPVKREKEEMKVLDIRRRNDQHRSDAEAVARIRDQVNGRYRQQKINAGYVILVVVSMEYKHLSYFSLFTATACSHASLITGVSLYRTITRVDTMRSRCRGLLMRIRW